jgi:hypothetical protein
MIDLEAELRDRFTQVVEPTLVPAPGLARTVRRRHTRRQALPPTGIAVLVVAGGGTLFGLTRGGEGGDRLTVAPATALPSPTAATTSSRPVLDGPSVTVGGFTFPTPGGFAVTNGPNRNDAPGLLSENVVLARGSSTMNIIVLRGHQSAVVSPAPPPPTFTIAGRAAHVTRAWAFVGHHLRGVATQLIVGTDDLQVIVYGTDLDPQVAVDSAAAALGGPAVGFTPPTVPSTDPEPVTFPDTVSLKGLTLPVPTGWALVERSSSPSAIVKNGTTSVQTLVLTGTSEAESLQYRLYDCPASDIVLDQDAPVTPTTIAGHAVSVVRSPNDASLRVLVSLTPTSALVVEASGLDKQALLSFVADALS